MQSPYVHILLAAAQHASAMPSLNTGIRVDPLADPSDDATRARNARVTASTIAALSHRAICAQRGDYRSIIGPRSGSFSTKR